MTGWSSPAGGSTTRTPDLPEMCSAWLRQREGLWWQVAKAATTWPHSLRCARTLRGQPQSRDCCGCRWWS